MTSSISPNPRPRHPENKVTPSGPPRTEKTLKSRLREKLAEAAEPRHLHARPWAPATGLGRPMAPSPSRRRAGSLAAEHLNGVAMSMNVCGLAVPRPTARPE